MSTAIAVFVKTPKLSPLKTRLGATIGDDKAHDFYHLSLEAIEKTLKAIDIKPYWAVGEIEGLSHPLWQSFDNLHTGEGGLGERQHHIYETLLKEHDRVLLIGADAPQISKDLIEQAVIALDKNDFVIGPARDGGYYLFGGRVSLTKEIWTSVPWSSPVTRDRLKALLPSKAIELKILTDVDTQENLQYLRDEMPEEISLEQKQILEWVEDL